MTLLRLEHRCCYREGMTRDDEEHAPPEALPAGGPVDESGTRSADAPIIPYATPARRADLKTLRRMPIFEANLAAAKLEAAGIPAFVGDGNMAAAHPVLQGQARLQVAEDNLAAAEAILAAPHAPAAGADDDDYVEEEYRCPKCHRKAVDLLPVSSGMRSTRLGCLGVLVLPVIVVLLANVLTMDGTTPSFPPLVIVAWAATLVVLSYIVITVKRQKRCRECGHEW